MTEKKISQQHAVLSTEMSYALVFQILDICFLEPVDKN